MYNKVPSLKVLLVSSISLLVLCAIMFVRYQSESILFIKQQFGERTLKNGSHLFYTAIEKKDVVNNSGAEKILKEFEVLFSSTTEKPSVPADPNKPETITTWWQAAAMIDWYIRSPIRQKCQNVTAMGNWNICQDEPFKIKPPCLVYSFGINWDFSFDNAMVNLGCEVHSFDPSMNQVDHKRGPNSYFHNIGLSDVNNDAFVARFDVYVSKEQVWKTRTVQAIMKELGHENRVIDVFKMDIEAYEWAVMNNMMNTGVFKHIRQMPMEYHLFPKYPLREDYLSFYKLVTRFREMGFREFHIAPYLRILDMNKFTNQGDMGYVNIFFNESDFSL